MAAKSAAEIARKWARVAPQRAEDYALGVANPRVSWSAASKGANERWKQGVTQAATRDAFSRGITAAGDQAWQQGATSKGPTRFAEGVSMSGPAYEAGVAKYIGVINSTPLPPRYARGDPRNLARVATLATALSKAKTG